jgi:hypothetical protein
LGSFPIADRTFRDPFGEQPEAAQHPIARKPKLPDAISPTCEVATIRDYIWFLKYCVSRLSMKLLETQ